MHDYWWPIWVGCANYWKMDMNQTLGFDECDIAEMSNEELSKLEREIARKYIGGMSWFMVVWPFANLICWLSLWPLVLTEILSVWIAFPIAFFNISYSYLPSHESQHDIYARPGEKLRWLNELIGHASLIPLVSSYRVLKMTHLEHHKHTNNPDFDPDYYIHAPNSFIAVCKMLKVRNPKSEFLDSYEKTLARLDPIQAGFAKRDAMIINFFYLAVLFVMAATGHALEAFLLWVLPLVLALVYIRFFLAWAPHHPGHETGRYRDTRAFKSLFGVIGTMGMTVHIVHHLHPRIPLDRTPAAFREMRPILHARNCDLGEI